MDRSSPWSPPSAAFDKEVCSVIMTKSKRAGWMGVTAAALASLCGLSSAAQAQHAQVAQSAISWRDEMWTSVDRGDTSNFLRLMDSSADPMRGDLATIRESTIGLKAALDKRERDRDESLAKTNTQFDEELANASGGEFSLSRALRYAIELSMLSRDKAQFLAESRVVDLIERAAGSAREAEARGDWLTANDLFMNLNALKEESARFRGDVERQIARLAMIRLYAPDKLWALRQDRREREREYALARAKDDAERETLQKNFAALPAYNPTGDRWNEKLAGISESMVYQALGRASRTHVDSITVEQMLRGGLESLRTLARTPDLQGAFPGLADETRRQAFLDQLDAHEQRVRAMGARAEFADMASLVVHLKSDNERSVRLPTIALFHEFGNGAMRALDEFSGIIWPDEMSRFNKSTQAKFVGVGVHIVMDETGSMVKVLTPLSGTPAHRAGIRPNDLITAVNGQSAIGFTLDQAVDVITGTPGTTVALTIERPDSSTGTKQELTFTMPRTEIKLPTVKGWKRMNADEDQWDWFIDPSSKIGYVRLTQFAETTDAEFVSAIRQMKERGLKSLILDLRFNPGGLLDQAVAVTNRFVANRAGVPFDGIVVTTHDASDKRIQVEQMESSQAPLADIPTVVLVNEGAASASEIVSGALQDYARAGAIRCVLVGQRSFGKGSVQNVWLLSQDQSSAIKVTTQYYKLPAGRLIHRRPGASEWGVVPNFAVEMLPEQIAEAYSLRQNADVFMLEDGAPAAAKPVADAQGKDKPKDLAERIKASNPDDLITKGIDLQLHHALVLLQSQTALGQGDGALPSLVAAPSTFPTVDDKKN
jgi:carboxyl-terminal processing protease